MSKRALSFFPDSFTIAVSLTFFVFILAVTMTSYSVNEVVLFWGNGLWNLLSFSMQMLLILICGSTLARAKVISIGLTKLASLVTSSSAAVVLVTVISLVGCYINWGFGLVISALLSVELAKRVKSIDFALLVASAYSGFLVWHGGLSGSIPLKLTSPSDEIKTYLRQDGLPLSETLFSPFNMTMISVVVVTVIAINFVLAKFFSKTEDLMIQKENENSQLTLTSHGLEHSKLFSTVFSLLGFSYLVLKFRAGESIDLNTMIMFFLFLGFALHSNFANYLSTFKNSLKDGSSIIIQFPIYAGIMGIVGQSGLGSDISEFFVNISSKESFLSFTYLSSGLLNIFVPSGGGQWAIQGPIILKAASRLGVEPSISAMVIAWGDAWTNMIQPFWALPILAISGASISHMMKYLFVIFVAVGGVSLFVIQLFS